jgi:HAD superfamily hydrolase (TIGR01509 family)
VSADLRPGVLFDVDGTLLDTNYLHSLAWSRALRDAGEWAPMNAIHRLIGMGGDQLVEELLGHDSPAAQAGRRARYQELIAEVRVFPGAAEVLHLAHEAGLAVVLASSSPADELAVLRERLGADDAIDAQTTADDVGSSKPDPEVFVQALHAGGVDPQRALAVGDSIWDVRAARAAGVGCVAVESGGSSRHELSEAGALVVYRDVDELRRQFHTSVLGQLARTAPGRRGRLFHRGGS